MSWNKLSPLNWARPLIIIGKLRHAEMQKLKNSEIWKCRNAEIGKWILLRAARLRRDEEMGERKNSEIGKFRNSIVKKCEDLRGPS